MAQAPASNVKLKKRGEYIVKPGERPKSVYFVVSGKVNLLQAKGDKKIELMQAADSHTIGEELISSAQWTSGAAVVLKDAQVMEIPADTLKQMISTVPAVPKALLTGLLERVKSTSNQLKALHTQEERTPCPPDSTARVFGVMLHSAKAVGKPEGSGLVADWQEFLEFAIDVLQENRVRIEEATFMLVKLGYAELELDAAGQKGIIRFKDISPLDYFFDFFHSYHFKGGYADLLKTNERASRITHEFLKIAEAYQPDRGGMITMPFKPTIDAMKAAFDGRFEPDQLFALQNKGLMVKLTPTNDGGVLSFYRQDFLQMLTNWKFLKEIELWNERGFVDTTPPSEEAPLPTAEQAANGAETPQAQNVAAPASAAAKQPAAKGKEAQPEKPRQLKPPSNAVQRFRKSEYLFKAGEPADRVFLLQSGLVSLTVQKNGASLELGQATAPQIVGEEALWGNPKWTTSAMAMNDTDALELSVQQAMSLVESFPGSLRMLIKSLLKKQRSVSAEIMAARLESGNTEPCPPEGIAKLFAVVYHAAISTGKVKNDRLTVVWPAFRKYCHWGLLESPVRLEGVVQMLSTLGYTELEMVKSETDPEAPDELGFVHFKDIEHLRAFYQYYHKNGAQGLDALIQSIESMEDAAPEALNSLAILKEIQNWNKTGKANPNAPSAEPGKKAA